MKQVDLQDNRLIIVFNGSYFSQNLAAMHALTDRFFMKDGRYWSAIDIPQNRDILTQAGFEFTARAKIKEKQKETSFEEIKVEISKKRVTELKTILPEFRDYQLEGVQFIEKNGRGLIADEMGLGKTAQAVGFLKVHPEQLPALIICPATLKFSWRDQIMKWFGEDARIEILEGTTPRLHPFAQFTIINYDILEDWAVALEVFPFKTIIGDEIQYISNSKAKRTVAFKFLARNMSYKIFLSGTPIRTRTAQFFNVLHLLDPLEFGNEYKFLHTYCDPRLTTVWMKINGKAQARQVWKFNGLTNWEILREKIKLLMIRREKKDVLKELPPKQKIIIPLPSEKTAFKEYLKEETIFQDWVKRDKSAKKEKKTQAVEHLKQLAYLAKRKAVLQWISDFIENEKLVIFVHNTDIIQDLSREFKNQCVVIDGSTKDREFQVKQFWENKEKTLFIGQDQTAGAGLNLQIASTVAFIQFPWTVADCLQCEDRVHRLNQENKVSIYYLIAEKTIEYHIASLLIERNKIVSKILDNKDNAKFFAESQDIMEELLKNYEKD